MHNKPLDIRVMSQTVEENAWVFISHSNKDFEQVRVIRNKLERRNYRPLLFYLKCLENEQELEDLIKREIDARERFILCKSKNIKGSDWVKKEMDYIKGTGRPYVVIDLDALKEDIDSCINLFDQRSTAYLFSTEGDVVGELKVLLAEKDFKVNTFKESLPSGVSMITKGAYFIILVSRDLKKDEVEQLNQLVKDSQLKAVAYEIFGRRTTKPTSSSQSFVSEYMIDDPVDNHDYDGWKDLDKIIEKGDPFEGIENSRVAESIVNELMSRDKVLNGEGPKREVEIEALVDKVHPHDDNPPILPRANKKDFAKRLKVYIELHRGGSPLQPIDKPSHTIWLGRRTKCKPSVQEDYLRRLDYEKLMDLINSHARKKNLYFSTISDCTDLEILLWAFEDLLCNGSAEAQAINDEHGSMSSALYYYIVHLLEKNNIII